MRSAEVWSDVVLASELFTTDPIGLGGIILRASPGVQRDTLCAHVRDHLSPGSPFLRVPLHVTEDRLLGGLSLAATLRSGNIVVEEGVLARANGGAIVLAMAERIESRVISHLCAALDRGEIRLERDGITANVECKFGIVALDEGIDDDERTPEALRDRLAFHLDLTPLDPRASVLLETNLERSAAAQARLPKVQIDEKIVEAICEAASALGIASLRAPMLAARAARAHAALEGRTLVEEEDAAVAARLVLGPRATQIPVPQPDEEKDQPSSEERDRKEHSRDHEEEKDHDAPSDAPLDDMLIEAAKSGIPAGLLDALTLGKSSRNSPKSRGTSGATRLSKQSGRPAGTRAAVPQDGDRLNVLETLRAAAPWQTLRRKERAKTKSAKSRRLEIRKDDFRITRFKERAETSVIFSVDASGSAALQRLAEAKGAVEQVLADCYVRRDHVALIAFRGTEATVLLPPTRSLARVRRSLAELAGGGTTPLARGIDAALSLALDAQKRGKTPVIVLMTDGRANVSRDGVEGGATAAEDATSSARAVRAAGIRTLFLDTAPRSRPHAKALAMEMGARYLPLPYLDAVGISRQVQTLVQAES